MVYYPPALGMRMRLIGEAVTKSGIYQWQDYDRKEPLDHWQNHGDDTASYGRNGRKSRIEIDNIQPVNIRDVKKSEPVTLDSRQIDAISARLNNLQAQPINLDHPELSGSDLTQEYAADFGKTMSEEESFWQELR